MAATVAVVAAAAVVEAAAEAVAVVEPIACDRVGIGWREALAAGIFANLESIDIVEVIADDYFHAGKTKLSALRRLADCLPVTLHGVTMGLASTIPVAPERMEKMAKLVAFLQPDTWSEHFAFVRAGGVEIGHLTAPPRTAQSVAGAIANIKAATRIVGRPPLLENIATLIDPPASSMDEAQWVSAIVYGANVDLLLDLHNLYANACNFGQDPTALLMQFPLERVRNVHIGGGKWIDEPGQHNPARTRLLDDHLHDVPTAVYDLLTVLAQHARQPLTVVLERDGHFPKFDHLLAQLDAARDALQRGRRLALRQRECA